MSVDDRTTLAVVEGFLKPRDHHAYGTQQAAYLICQALARQRRYAALHVYLDRHREIGRASCRERVYVLV